MHILITAGPTREYLDPVRFITNGSTGKMGYACASEALKKGHRVTLISGPVTIESPKGAEVIKVLTSAEMAAAVADVFPSCDCVIMTAAVGDYKPQQTSRYKISKTQDSMCLTLIRTPDILAELGQKKQCQKLIGFAVQDKAARQNARRKLKSKNLDAIVLNAPSAIGADKTTVQILRKGRSWQVFENVTKMKVAKVVVKLAESVVK